MGKRVLPREVSAALAARGIEVSRGQISQVLKSMGLRRRRRKRSAPVSSTPATARGTGGVSIDDLVAAKKLADQLGGIEKARAVLAGLARLM
jgi:arginine repressor